MIGVNSRFQVLRKDTLEPVGTVPKLTDISYDHAGQLHGVDEKGRLGICNLNLDNIWNSIQLDIATRLGATQTELITDLSQQLQGVRF